MPQCLSACSAHPHSLTADAIQTPTAETVFHAIPASVQLHLAADAIQTPTAAQAFPATPEAVQPHRMADAIQTPTAAAEAATPVNAQMAAADAIQTPTAETVFHAIPAPAQLHLAADAIQTPTAVQASPAILVNAQPLRKENAIQTPTAAAEAATPVNAQINIYFILFGTARLCKNAYGALFFGPCARLAHTAFCARLSACRIRLAISNTQESAQAPATHNCPSTQRL